MTRDRTRKGQVGKNLPPFDWSTPQRWSLAERIRFAVAKCGERPDLHRDLGVSARTLARYKSGETVPDDTFLAALSQVSGSRLAWLRAGGHLPPAPAQVDTNGHVVVRLPLDALRALLQAIATAITPEIREAIIAALQAPPPPAAPAPEHSPPRMPGEE